MTSRRFAPPVELRRSLASWYRPRRRAYPWRGETDPYRILVSEVMLQQTQAARVVPAYERFVQQFPSVETLAGARRGDVLRAWDGLGYNRRAVALSEAARRIVADQGGTIPSRTEDLRRLPGVGAYTAAAVAALAFGARIPAVDTNVRRVVARAVVGREPDDVASVELDGAARAFLGRADPATWNQAMMDLGRGVCRSLPDCGACPLSGGCRFLVAGRRPRRRRSRQGAFEGSSRQVRGTVVHHLRGQASATIAALSSTTGVAPDRIARAVAELHRDGVVDAGPAALRGRPGGRVRLSEG